MIFGAILAGGVGARMGSTDRPKQFLSLGDKPIIIHTLEKFLTCPKFDKIYVGVHKDYLLYFCDLLTKYNLSDERVEAISGGADRSSTIFNIVDEILSKYGEENIVVTHDAVRPFVTLKVIENNIEAAQRYGACDTVIRANDTIVTSKDGERISDIPERKYMYQGQTPQSFKVGLLSKVYNELREDEKAILTDACKIFVLKGLPVKLVEGASSNFKITTVSDYKLATAMLGGKQN